MIKAIIAAALSLVVTQASAYTFTPEGGTRGGGKLDLFYHHVQQLDDYGAEVRLDMLTCTSACTYYLTANNVCVGENSLFKFHGPSAGWTGAASFLTGIPVSTITHGMDEKERSKVIEEMRSVYDSRWPGLGAWFVERASHKHGVNTTDVRGKSLHNAFGIPFCKGDKK